MRIGARCVNSVRIMSMEEYVTIPCLSVKVGLPWASGREEIPHSNCMASDDVIVLYASWVPREL